MHQLPNATIVAASASLALAGCGGNETPPSKAAAPARAPTPTATAAVSPTAKSVYDGNCLTCHGASGAGDGEMVSMLRVKPRSFAAETWRFVDFTAGEAVVRAEVERVIRDGIPDAMMPGFGQSFSEDQIRALADYVLELRRTGREG